MSASDTSPATASSAARPRFAEALRELGLDVEVRRFPDATRTAAEAAAAVGCGLGQIVKSPIFEADGVPPFGHRTRTRVPAGRGLLRHAVVRAAAGTPHTVFPPGPESLIAHAGGTAVAVRERTA